MASLRCASRLRSLARSCEGSRSAQSLPSSRPYGAMLRAPSHLHSQRRGESSAASMPNPKISSIVDQISQLTLLETADLVTSLKQRLNIPDLPVGGFAAAPGAANSAAGAAAPAAEEEDVAPKQEEKTLFNLKLQSIDAAAKPKIIKEIKQLLGLSLVDSKKFVESAPKLMKESVPKEECEKIVETMKALGAVVAME